MDEGGGGVRGNALQDQNRSILNLSVTANVSITTLNTLGVFTITQALLDVIISKYSSVTRLTFYIVLHKWLFREKYITKCLVQNVNNNDVMLPGKITCAICNPPWRGQETSQIPFSE